MIARRIDTVATIVEPVRDLIARYADQMEAERRMPEELHQALAAAGLYGIHLPKSLGGAGLTLPEGLRVVEAVAAIDGSTGWTVALSFAAGYFSGVIDPEAAAEIFGQGPVLVAGGGKPLKATRVAGGYRISGQLPYASGVVHAGWINGRAVVHDGDVPRMGTGGPQMVGWFIPRSQVQVVDTWHVTGLCGSGTHDALIEDVFVPEERIALGDGVFGFAARSDDPLLRIPFFSLAALVQSAPNILGIARHAMQEFRKIAESKVNPMTGAALRDREAIQARTAQAEAKIRAARAFYFATAQEAWDTAERGGPFDNELRASVRMAATLVAEQCIEAVEALYRMAGTSAISAPSAFERCSRDIHAAASHIQVQDGNWEPAGRVLLGLEPATPLF